MEPLGMLPLQPEVHWETLHILRLGVKHPILESSPGRGGLEALLPLGAENYEAWWPRERWTTSHHPHPVSCHFSGATSSWAPWF